MSATYHRGIIIDDDDPTVQYKGQWTPLDASWGLLGTVHQLMTLSGIVGVSTNFTGTSIIAGVTTVHTTNATVAAANPAINYTVNCLIDGKSTSNASLSEGFAGLSTALCNTTQNLAADTVHTLDIMLHIPSPSPQFLFFFDYFIATPAQNQDLSGQENIIFYGDDAVIESTIDQANAGWNKQGDSFQTSVNGSQFTFLFTGVSVTWYAKNAQNTQLANSTATYAIDGGEPLSFAIAPVPNSNQPELFTTRQYPYGNHTLHVVYQGNNGSLPLSIAALFIQRVPSANPAGVAPSSIGAILPSQSASAPGSVISSSTAASHHHGIDKSQLGGILGGVIALILIIIASIAYWRGVHRKRTQAPAKSVSVEGSSPLDDEGGLVPSPFPLAAPEERQERLGKTGMTASTHAPSATHDMLENGQGQVSTSVPPPEYSVR